MKNKYLILICCSALIFISAPAISSASNSDFTLNSFDIDGLRIGDSRSNFLRAFEGPQSVISKTSLLYHKPVSCEAEKAGISRCRSKSAEMVQPSAGKQKSFRHYRDVVADFNHNNQLSFLSTIETTRYKDGKACLKALSSFYKQASNKTLKPLVIYPRNQLDIYYIKIDEQPFATHMMGKLESAFSMVWQAKRSDWTKFYSVDFGCRENGYMVVNTTLYDQAVKYQDQSFKFQVSSFKFQD